jgi:hypothetical protein
VISQTGDFTHLPKLAMWNQRFAERSFGGWDASPELKDLFAYLQKCVAGGRFCTWLSALGRYDIQGAVGFDYRPQAGGEIRSALWRLTRSSSRNKLLAVVAQLDGHFGVAFDTSRNCSTSFSFFTLIRW